MHLLCPQLRLMITKINTLCNAILVSMKWASNFGWEMVTKHLPRINTANTDVLNWSSQYAEGGGRLKHSVITWLHWILSFWQTLSTHSRNCLCSTSGTMVDWLTMGVGGELLPRKLCLVAPRSGTLVQALSQSKYCTCKITHLYGKLTYKVNILKPLFTISEKNFDHL